MPVALAENLASACTCAQVARSTWPGAGKSCAAKYGGGTEVGRSTKRVADDAMRVKKSVAKFLRWQRVCRVATRSRAGVPHVVPVCHVFDGDTLYFASEGADKKVKNLRARRSRSPSTSTRMTGRCCAACSCRAPSS